MQSLPLFSQDNFGKLLGFRIKKDSVHLVALLILHNIFFQQFTFLEKAMNSAFPFEVLSRAYFWPSFSKRLLLLNRERYKQCLFKDNVNQTAYFFRIFQISLFFKEIRLYQLQKCKISNKFEKEIISSSNFPIKKTTTKGAPAKTNFRLLQNFKWMKL